MAFIPSTVKTFLRRINWTNTLFLTLTPLIGITGLVLILIYGTLFTSTLVLAGVLTLLTGLAVTTGYHRLFSHKAYRTIAPVRVLLLLFSASVFEGSALEWCSDHRRHHCYTDTDRDPYGVNKGFWHAHMGWLLFLNTQLRNFDNVADLAADPLLRLQHRFFVPLATFMGFLLPTAIAWCWGDPWGGLIIAGFLRIVFLQQMTFCINSVCHTFGERSFQEQASARNNWLAAFLTFGEGFHSFHHQFPSDYRNGIRSYDFDPSKWLIRALAYLGLAKDLKRVRNEQIIRFRIHAEENKMLAQIKNYSLENFVQPIRDRVLKSAAYLEQLEKDYHEYKNNKILYFQNNMNKYRLHLKAQRRRLKKAHLELNNSLLQWAELMRGVLPEKISIPS